MRIGSFEIFTHIQFYIWLNDSGNNILQLDNNGQYYSIKIIPHDLTAPSIAIEEIPETITTMQNITVTVQINETSNLLSVDVLYRVQDKQYSIAMKQISSDTWSASFVVQATTGDTVQIWIRAIDEYYNTAETDIEEFEVEAVYLFGPLSYEEFREGMNIDLAVEGVSSDTFASALGHLKQISTFGVELTDIRQADGWTKRSIGQKGKLLAKKSPEN